MLDSSMELTHFADNDVSIPERFFVVPSVNFDPLEGSKFMHPTNLKMQKC